MEYFAFKMFRSPVWDDNNTYSCTLRTWAPISNENWLLIIELNILRKCFVKIKKNVLQKRAISSKYFESYVWEYEHFFRYARASELYWLKCQCMRISLQKAINLYFQKFNIILGHLIWFFSQNIFMYII